MKTSGGKAMRVKSSRSFILRQRRPGKLTKDEMRKLGEQAMRSHPITRLPTSYIDATKIYDNLKKSILHVPIDTGDVVGHFFTNEDGSAGSRKD